MLREIGRYGIRRPRVALLFDWQVWTPQPDGYTVSDWVGCPSSRRSTSGCAIVAGRHLIKSWSRQQKMAALSSADAETYAMVCCSAGLLGIQACARDLGTGVQRSGVRTRVEGSGMIKRQDVGKVLHIRTQSLWLQEARAEKRLAFEKIAAAAIPPICSPSTWRRC